MTTGNNRADALTDDRIKEVVDAIDFSTMVTADDFIYVIARAIEREVRAASPVEQPAAAPIDMLLFCPACGDQHIDAPEDTSENEPYRHPGLWSNPPHRSHLCHACGCIWRPADVPTNGVAATQTRGKADTWDGSESWSKYSENDE